MRRISVLGATGSVGTQTLDCVRSGGFNVVALCANRHVELLAAQAREFQPEFVAIADTSCFSELKALLSDMPHIQVAAGAQAIIEAARIEADIVMAAIVGVAGLAPTMAAIEQGRTVAFASKECLVAAGPLMMAAVQKCGTTFLPVDSEHNAIFQVLQNGVIPTRIVLTASGGPFRETPLDQMKGITPAQAIKHPTWSMGAKISVDSATLMNKALEVIEAHHLFGLPSEKIDVLIHPQSIVHGMVEYADGSLLAQLGPADMRTPISVCLGWPARRASPGGRLDLAQISRLEFAPVDTVRFPAMALVRHVLAGGMEDAIAFNAANEVAVARFLAGALPFEAIVPTVVDILAACPKLAIKTLDDVIAFDENIRELTFKKAA